MHRDPNFFAQNCESLQRVTLVKIRDHPELIASTARNRNPDYNVEHALIVVVVV
jgi:hypothetical protein